MVTAAGKTILFKEWEIIVDEEDEVINCSNLNYYYKLCIFN